ncbi:MAG: serine/threonine-protein phosphatase, partial [Clostridia bacterium]|nr:serine/threonine-protein phosphatase [Clostridia bacterium]
MNKETNKYLEAYYDNEADANKQMIFANVFSGIVLFVIWILYLTKVFPVYNNTFTLINIFFPVNIFILVSPLIYLKKGLRKPKLKYFLVFSFIFVISILNVIIPKHAIIGWALCLVIVNHYYNPKLGKIAFGVVLAMMLVCLYLAMFIGEYDPNLLGEGIIQDGKIEYVYGIKNRYDYLHEQLANGNNRYLKVFGFYYLSRTILLALVFFVSNALNKRTYKLFMTEISINTEQSKTKTELEVASQLQLSTLPVEFLTNKDIEIQAELKPAKMVGGDFYDYYRLSNDEVAILIGDVSGKGIPAAMFMMKVITCFKNYISLDKTPSQILKDVNNAIFKNNNAQMFATCFLAIINTSTGLVRYANAGHNPPIIGHSKNYRYLPTNNGVMLGIVENANLIDEQTYLQNGETITLYTDGITEAKNDKDEMYNESRLINLFNKKDYSCLLELHHALKDDIEKFTNGAEQSDDLTYLTLKFHGDTYFYDEKTFITQTNKI